MLFQFVETVCRFAFPDLLPQLRRQIDGRDRHRSGDQPLPDGRVVTTQWFRHGTEPAARCRAAC